LSNYNPRLNIFNVGQIKGRSFKRPGWRETVGKLGKGKRMRRGGAGMESRVGKDLALDYSQ